MYPDPNDAVDDWYKAHDPERQPARNDIPFDGMVYLEAVKAGKREEDAVIEVALRRGKARR